MNECKCLGARDKFTKCISQFFCENDGGYEVTVEMRLFKTRLIVMAIVIVEGFK